MNPPARARRALSWSGIAIFLFLWAPLLVVMLQSFNAAPYGTRWTGVTGQWYVKLFRDVGAGLAAWNSLQLALWSTGIATVLGTMLALALHDRRLPARGLFRMNLYLPVVIPDIVMAVALLLFYALVRMWKGWFEPGMLTMVLGHATFEIPFVALVVRARMAGLDPALFEAARDLGANPWQGFWHVKFPLIWPGVLAGALLAFTLSLDDFVISFFTGGAGNTTLAVHIYSLVKRGISPEIHALSTLLIVVSVLATLAVTWLQRRNQARPAPPAGV